MGWRRSALVLVLAVGVVASVEAQTAHVFFHVQSAASNAAPLSGRLLIFLKAGVAAKTGDKSVELDEFHPAAVSVAAREVSDLKPGDVVEVDADAVAYPKPFSSATPGDYEVQAVLDVDHTYNYTGRSESDWISSVTQLSNWTPGSGPEPVLTLDQHPPVNERRQKAMAKATAEAAGTAVREDFTSPVLSAFWGHPVAIKAWVVLPPKYEQSQGERYPTAFWTHGFGGTIESALMSGMAIRQRMKDGKMPPMIWVMLDESCAQGTHEFADSVNNGPWGKALTTEFIPYLEHKYRMDAKASGRLLNGHSSGGWATLQLQVNYPTVFGGTWSTSPDPSDFHDFTGSDLYAAQANVYHNASGEATPIMRDQGKVLASFQQFAQLEDVLGPYGGQVSSFDWVFSPKADGGAPRQMFDHKTGDVRRDVVAYWHDHYDLANLVTRRWAQDGKLLKGRIHLFVGTADTFYLDGAAHKFEGVLQGLGAEPHFTYIPDRTHFDLYKVGADQRGLFDQIGEEMYAVARPRTDWKKAAGN